MWKRLKWESRMNKELEFHIESLTEEYMAQGLPRAEAIQKARRDFGAMELAKDECRDQKPSNWLDNLSRDIRYAFRTLRKSPGFAAAAIVTLALGIGANTAVFSVAYAVLMRPLPYADPDKIYSVEAVIQQRTSQFPSLPVPVQAFLEWRRSQTGFSAMAALRQWECNISGDGEPERLGGARVTTNFFEFLGVSVAHGRTFMPGEEQPGNDRVVVISDALWRRRYGANPAIIGKPIDINGTSHLVVGVASPSLLVPTGNLLHPLITFAPRIDIWKPIAPTPRELQNESWDHGMLVRLGPGATAEQGRQQLEAILTAFYRTVAPGANIDFKINLVPIREVFSGKIRLRLLLVLAAAALLLLTACTNIANLFLARLTSRSVEFATRVALGASRGRIVCQALTETTVLALGGGLVGAVIAAFGTELLSGLGTGEMRLLSASPLNLPAFLFAIAASLVTGIVCGIVPAWKAPGFHGNTRTTTAGSGRTLIVIEVALGTALLASAGLLLHSFVNVMRAGRGYQIERVLSVDLSLFGNRKTTFYRDVSENLRAIPGVLAAGAITDSPATAASTGASRTIFHPTDTDFQRDVLSRPVAMIRGTTGGYFSASGTTLRAGRYLQPTEPIPTGLISESLAASLWPSEPLSAAVGRTIRQGNVTGPLLTIVGIVENVRPGSADRESPPVIYRPYDQWASGPATLMIRTAQEPAALANAVRETIRKMDPGLPIPAIRTMREIVLDAVSPRRFQLMLIALFAFVALLLGAVGVYAVVSFSVHSRTREIGLRIALGAMRADVLKWVVFTGMRPVLIGLVIGLAGAVAIAKLLQSQLFGISPADPLALGGVVGVLLLTSGLACFLPARRAARLDPQVALRHE